MKKTSQKDLVDAIFLEAIDVEANRRAEFLDQRCVDVPQEVRSEVEKLLRGDDAAAEVDVTANPDLNVARFLPIAATRGGHDEIGKYVHDYRLLEKIGEGGMGVVYVADQKKPVRRRVAIKLIKPGMDTEQVMARFEAERQALAMMDHPSIAKVLDTGTTKNGRPFFVMELVKGRPITEYCDEKRLSVEYRLRLFVSVCRAVQHAHQKGVIHRDLKPSNVLVAEYDNVAVPKVIDFGLAKALQQPLTEKTFFTQFGQIVGTFEYMSPEQAKLNQLDIDTRSDIYSLGVLLYELLTGHTPFDSKTLRNAALDEMLKIIREAEPVIPSVKLASSQTSNTTAQSRQTDATHLTRRLRGDLDAIAMKALDKDRGERYDSSSALADDIERYLNDEQIIAASPSYLRYWGRFVKRNRRAVAIATAIALILITTALLGLRSMHLAEQNRLLSMKQKSIVRDDMLLAQAAWEIGDIDRVRAILAKHEPQEGQPDFRQFEAGYLERLCGECEEQRPLRSVAGVQRFAFRHADNTLFIAHAEGLSLAEKEFSLGDLITAKKVVDVSPDGLLAVYATNGRTDVKLSLYDIELEQTVDSLDYEDHLESLSGPVSRQVVHVIYSPDGRRVATTPLEAGFVSLWHVTESRKLQFDKVLRAPPIQMEYGTEQEWIKCLSFSHDGSRLAAGDYDGIVRVWDVSSGRKVAELNHDATAYSLAFNHDDSQLVVGSSRGVSLGMSFTFWDCSDWQRRLQERTLHVPTTGFALSPNSKYLATGSSAGIVRLLDAATFDELQVYRGHQNQTTVIEFSQDSRQLATADGDGKVFIWPVRPVVLQQQKRQKPSARNLVKLHNTRVRTIDFHPTKNLLATADSDGIVNVLNTDTLTSVVSQYQHTGYLDYVEFIDRGTKLAFGRGGRRGNNGGTWIMDLQRPSEEPDWIEACWMRYHPHLDLYFRVRGDWTARQMSALYSKHDASLDDFDFAFYNVRGFRPIGYGAAAFAPRQPFLTVGGQKGWVATWDVVKHQPRWAHQDGHPSHVSACAVSPDESTVATASLTGHCIVWQLNDGARLQSLAGHSAEVYGIDYSPDGSTIATASLDGTVRLWDSSSGEERFAFEGGRAGFWAAKFSPDGTTLAAADDDGMIWLWRSNARQNR